jgi:FkbM family methyltransferase
MGRLRTRLATIAGVLGQVVGLRGKLRVLAAKLRPADPDRVGVEAAIEVELRGLGPVLIRPRTTDESLIYGHLAMGQHRPPAAAAGRPMQQICELGTNIGIGLGDLAVRYPQARLLGVEADPDNAVLARRNLARFGERCELVEAAVWSAPGRLELSGDLPGLLAPGAGGGRVERSVEAITVAELLERHMPEGPIDYMHLDVVGSEPELLDASSEWAARVRSLKIQLYDDRGFETEECLAILRALGFEASTETAAHGRFATGVRPA